MSMPDLACPLHLESNQDCLLRRNDIDAANLPADAANLHSLGKGYGETWQGFGGCFNELGWDALQILDQEARSQVLDSLFSPTGLNLDIGRLPIGASDYARSWYSYHEQAEDLELKSFSIQRDHTGVIPYLKEALKRRPDMDLFASPWSPPTWMKRPPAYNYGRFRMEERYLDAYARYFAAYLKAYQEAGIRIKRVHPQNEPCADQKFPSCVWSGEQLARFIGEHLGPTLERECPHVETWLGTINSGDFAEMFLPVLLDPAARSFIGGVGLQWDGKNALSQIRQSEPRLPIWQTENECGDGSNDWDYAHYIFDLVSSYVNGGTSAYVYWNMVLEKGGESTWGWKQNSLVTVDPDSRRWTFNPEYYVLQHLTPFIRPGYRRLQLAGPWAPCSVAFASEQGITTLATHNPTTSPQVLKADVHGCQTVVQLAPKSFHTFVWEA